MAECLGVWLDSKDGKIHDGEQLQTTLHFFEGSYSAAHLKSSLCFCLDSSEISRTSQTSM